MTVFTCADCGARVHWAGIEQQPDPVLCFVCDWIRTMPEAERQGLRDFLRQNSEDQKPTSTPPQ